MVSFVTALPEVKLVGANYYDPFRLAAGAAKTCYRPPNISTPVDPDSIAPEKILDYAKRTYKSGHHSCWMHVNMTFSISNVSRDLVHDWLHIFPHYNTDQISQRYKWMVDGKIPKEETRVCVPAFVNTNNRQTLLELYAQQFQSYKDLAELVIEDLAGLGKLRPNDLTLNQKGGLEKKAIELARYVLPVGTLTGLYYTINAITLYRLFISAPTAPKSWEATLLAQAMRTAVETIMPNFFKLIGEQMPRGEGIIHALRSDGDIGTYNKKFDAMLGSKNSKLIVYQEYGERLLADGVRNALGMLDSQLSDSDAIDLVLGSRRNRTLIHELDLEHHDIVSKAMGLVNYTFAKSMSHTCHSQLQRHRLEFGPVPSLTLHNTPKPDFIMPELIAKNAETRTIMEEIMNDSWQVKNELIGRGEPSEFAVYALPNAARVRFISSVDLLNFRHRQEIRSCLRAQQEAWQITMEEIAQIAEVHPRIARHFGPPCILRAAAAVSPPCNQGELYCGLPVWKLGADWHSKSMREGYYPRKRVMARGV